MATELVNSATSEKLTETDWTKNIEICELVARDNRQAKDVIKAIKKRLGSKNPTTQLLAVTLLETLLNNIGDPVHKQVVETGVLPVLVKIVKKKSEISLGEKIFLLLDAAQTSVGGASGRYPQYYSAYQELVSAGVQFPQRPHVIPKEHPVSSNDVKNNPRGSELAPSHCEKNAPQPETQKVPDSSILQKASAALEILREVIDAVDTQHPEGAKDEFTLDLVEQCSFQKQRVVHLAMTSRDDDVVSKAIELNEQLDRVLERHDALVAGRPVSTLTPVVAHNLSDEEEEEAEQLFRRMRKGKARIQPQDEDNQTDRPMGLLGSSVPRNMLHRPLIRPVSIEQKQEIDTGKETVTTHPPPAKHAQRDQQRENEIEKADFTIPPPPAKHAQREQKQETDTGKGAFTIPPALAKQAQREQKQENDTGKAAFTIPPPPAKHAEREKFFQENKMDGSNHVTSHMRGLSLHRRNASSSLSGNIDFDI